MTTKSRILISLVCLASAFAIGRYTAQPSAVSATVVKNNVIDTKVDKDTHKETTTVTEKKPDGTTKTTTKVTEDTETKKQIDSKTKEKDIVSVQPSKTLNISGLAGIDLARQMPVYGVSINKQVLGPFTLGAYGLTNGVIGVSIGLNF